jgi:hypothetical protein
MRITHAPRVAPVPDLIPRLLRMGHSTDPETAAPADVFHHCAYRVHPTRAELRHFRRSAAQQRQYYDI